MKKLLLITLMMILSSQLFAQENAKVQRVKTKSNQTNDNEIKPENGMINAFIYDADFAFDAPDICKYLGIESLTILKGKYEVDRSDEGKGGKITLKIKPIKLTNRLEVPKEQVFRGKAPSGQTCKGEGTSCFYLPDGSPTKDKDAQVFTVTPITENGVMTKMEVQYKGSGSPKNQGF